MDSMGEWIARRVQKKSIALSFDVCVDVCVCVLYACVF